MIKITNNSAKRVRVSSTWSSFFLDPGGTRVAGDPARASAAQAGCDVITVDGAVAGSEVSSISDQEREDAIRVGVECFVAEGNPENFTSQGKIRLNKLNDFVGFETNRDEVDRIAEDVTHVDADDAA